MGRSLALGLYLLLAERGGPDVAADRPARESGALVWIHAAPHGREESLRQLAALFRDERPDLQLLATRGGGLADAGEEVLTDRPPGERLPEVRAFLDHWRPDAALFLGLPVPAALAAEAHERRVPMFLADAKPGPEALSFWQRGITGSVLARFDRILAQDAEAVQALRRLGGRTLAVELGGRIEAAAEPPGCVEAERDVLAGLLRARPVWCAAACPQAEEEAVIAAHVRGMQHAHRLLLILAPADHARAAPLARELSERGFVVAEQAAGEEPSPDIQIFVAENTADLGLWYRLAPVTYLGGTLVGDGGPLNPLDPAALGSAIIHGPRTGARQDAYRRLVEARATRPVVSAEDLAVAVADLIAPDRAALLAHSAWGVTSGGADVAERVVRLVLSALDPVAKERA
jgi:3-deoxy-D-manno-octulosonic-acid transferase